jgi:hypothetical protein
MTVSYGFLSTRPPTQCGLATVNSALAAHLTAVSRSAGVVRVTAEGDVQTPRSDVVHTWSAKTAAGWLPADAALNVSFRAATACLTSSAPAAVSCTKELSGCGRGQRRAGGLRHHRRLHAVGSDGPLLTCAGPQAVPEEVSIHGNR